MSAASHLFSGGKRRNVDLEAGERIRFRFPEGNVFRMYMAAPGEEFQEYSDTEQLGSLATITNKKDSAYYTDV